MLLDERKEKPDYRDHDLGRDRRPNNGESQSGDEARVRLRATIIGTLIVLASLLLGLAFRDPYGQKTVLERSPAYVERPITSYSPAQGTR